MRKRILQLVAVAVLAVCVGSHISELADHWDHTFQTGNDIESTLIVVALTVGAAISLATVIALTVLSPRWEPGAALPSFQIRTTTILDRPTHSPPLIPLRI